MYHYVYKITNLITGEFYIGKHSTYKLFDNYMGSGSKIRQSINKYGIEHFKKEVLCSCETPDDAFIKEHELITNHISDPLCYNIDTSLGRASWKSKQMKNHYPSLNVKKC
jgi:hypothetical protein